MASAIGDHMERDLLLSPARHLGLILMAAGLAISLSACGESKGELQVLQRKEPKTLLEQGSALTEAEASRRQKAHEQSRAKVEVEQKLIKAISKLNAAKDVDNIVESLDRLGKAGHKAAPYFAKLETFMAHKDADVRATALEAMSAVDGKAAYRYQRTALRDPSAMVRRRAVAIWSKARPDDVGSLVGLLGDDDSRVQYEVLQALAAGKPDAAILSQVANSVEDLDGSGAKAALMLVLPRRREVKEFDTMVAYLLDHQDETARLKACDVLQQAKVIDDQIAVKVLQTAIEDPSPAVRRSCHGWLKALSPKPLPPFDPNADDATRMARFDALAKFIKSLSGLWPK